MSLAERFRGGKPGNHERAYFPEDSPRTPAPRSLEQAQLDQWIWAVRSDPARARKVLLELIEDDLADAIAEAVK